MVNQIPSTSPSPSTSTEPSRSRIRVAVVGLALAAVLVVAGCSSSSGNDAEGSVRVVAPTAARELLDDGTGRVLIDVRTPEEFDEARLDGALLIDFYRDDFEAAMSELDRNQPYVIYCRSGSRSGQARELMAELGFTDVADIDGGILAWQSEGLPTVK